MVLVRSRDGRFPLTAPHINKASSSTSSPTMKLNFSRTKLYGRTEELAILRDAYLRVRDSESCSSEAVLVHGCSGAGKTSFIEKLKTLENDDTGAFFISGKFDQQRTLEPYSALAVAFNDLCDQILVSNDKAHLGASIKKAVGRQGKNLLNIVSRLGAVTGSLDGNVNAADNRQAQNQLKLVFRAFMRSVCTPNNPVVLIIDDLQWADTASLEIITSLIADSLSRNFLFVGSYRDHEMDKSHPLCQQFRKLEKEKPIRWIKLVNLDLIQVNQLVSDVLELAATKTQPLADDVYGKTDGNPFFVIQFLKLLQEEGFLYFCIATYEWRYNMEQIKAETNLAENVVDIVADKIRRLPRNVQSVLKLAACLASAFDADILESIISHVEQRARNLEMGSDLYNHIAELSLVKQGGIVTFLDLAVEEHLLAHDKTSKYRFAHDRIQQAAYSLLPDESERDLLHLWIGELLLKVCESAEGGELMLFIAADQLDRGSVYVTDKGKRIDLARLNLAAGKQAISMSAFVPAASYLKSGIGLLDVEVMWEEQYDLALDLCSTSAEMAYCNGDTEHCRELVDAVLTHARCTRDKLQVYFTLLDVLSAQQRFEEALDIGFNVLRELGEHFPKRANLLHVVKDLRKTQRMLQGLSDDDLLTHPVMDDENKIAAMKLLSVLGPRAYFLQRKAQLALITFRMVQRSIRFGMSEHSPLSFASYGMILCNIGTNLREVYRFGRIALKLSDQLNGQREVQVIGVVHQFLSHWQAPIQDSLEPLLCGYQRGMESGNIEWAFLSAASYVVAYLYAGLRLKPLEQDIASYHQQTVEYNQDATAMMTLLYLQFVRNLMGRSSDPVELSGEAMDQETVLQRILEANNKAAISTFWLLRMQLAYYFGDMELASQVLESSNFTDVKARLVFHVWTFFSGLVSLELLRTTKRRKHRVRARKVIKLMKKWVSVGAVNSVHKLRLLEAEYNGLTGKEHSSVRHSYDTAISMASKAGFLQDAALAHERAGIFCLESGDAFWASTYLTRAHELYCEWGAQAKADHMVRQHAGEFTPSEATRHTSGHKSRSRFSKRSSLRHKELRLSATAGPPAA